MDSNLVFLASNLHERKQLLLRLDLVECVSSIFFDRRNLFMAFFIISFHQIFSRPTKCRLVPFGHFFSSDCLLSIFEFPLHSSIHHRWYLLLSVCLLIVAILLVIVKCTSIVLRCFVFVNHSSPYSAVPKSLWYHLL